MSSSRYAERDRCAWRAYHVWRKLEDIPRAIERVRFILDRGRLLAERYRRAIRAPWIPNDMAHWPGSALYLNPERAQRIGEGECGDCAFRNQPERGRVCERHHTCNSRRERVLRALIAID